MKAHALALPAALALASCAGGSQAEEDAGEGVIAPAAESDPAAVAAAADAAGSGIPQALQGRWGLVPADCEPGRADAKGLLVVDGDSLEFYESTARLGEVADRTAGRIRATFAFTGEGMEWEREIEFATPDAGATMLRRDFGEEAPAEPLEYARCT